MKFDSFGRLILGFIAGVVLISCGGGGNNLVANSGGIGGTGVVYGPITGFGSIFVNGLEIEIANAAITSDDSEVIETELKLGMVVKVEGTFNTNNLTGTATAVTYKDNLEGPISSSSAGIDVTTKELVVLGQTVIISDTTTNFENTTFATIDVGNVIEVSGLVDDMGAIRASHVEKKLDGFVDGRDEIEVKGTIQNLDVTPGTFEINALVVDYLTTGASLPQGGLADGQYVEVKGMSFGSSDELIATEIELEDEGLGDDSSHDGDYVEIEGFVSSVSSPAEFTVGAQPVQITSSTRYEGGTIANILAGIRVEVEGTLSSGVLVAQEISIEDESDDD